MTTQDTSPQHERYLNDTGKAVEDLICFDLYDNALSNVGEGYDEEMGIEVIPVDPQDPDDLWEPRCHILIKNHYALAAYLAMIAQKRFDLIKKED